MKGVKNLKLKNYLNTIYSKSHIIHEFDNVHALGLGIKVRWGICPSAWALSMAHH